MKMKKKIKRGIAALSAAVMFLGLLPLTPDNTITVQAAGNEPSLATYATKAQLMDGTFAPNADGTANNICKIAFGKDENSNVLQWYVLGQDTGVSGDNTVIFAASPIRTGIKFNSTSGEKDYYEDGQIKKVYASHWGASNLRAVLQATVSSENLNFFSEAEKALMQTTTLQTEDLKTQTIYTTTDRLYVPAAAIQGLYVNVKIGSSDNKGLRRSTYWSSGDPFWTREPSGANEEVKAIPGDDFLPGRVDAEDVSVRPASNLNLTNVLFAFAGRAAEGNTTVSTSSPMILRLDGTGKSIGTVTYNAETKVITAKKDTAATGNVYLMVLGNDNGTDKLYSTTIGPSTTVNVATAPWLEYVDLSTCKIWLENVSDGMLYAVTATPEPTALEQISSVEVTIDLPTAGNWLAANAACATTGVSNTKPVLTWTPNDDSVVGGREYTASVRLTAASGYEFTDSTAATVNGEQATATKNGDGTLTVTHSFTAATVKDKLKEIIAPDPVTVTNGTNYWIIEDMLPKTVNIVTENQTVTSATVEWNKDPLENGGYSATETKEQRVTLTGTVTCPDTVDANGVSLTTSITVIISGSGSTTPIQISNVEVTIPAPVPGSPIPTYADATCAQEGVSCTAMGWTPNDTVVQWGRQYGVTVMLKAPSGYEFTNSTTATVNGEAATKVWKEENFGNLYVSYEFARTPAAPGGKDKLMSITTPATITVANGTAADEIIKKLPATVGIETANKTVASATVTWDTEPLKKVYSPSETEQQGITLTGDVICPETVDAGDVQLYISITIMISAAGAPPATPTPAPVTPTPAPATPATPAPATPAPASYYIMDGANSSWVRNEDGSMAIRGNGEISKFTGVKVDGVLIDPANYIVTEGSTIVTLKPEYLNTLSEGSHSFEILWADGSAATDFTVTGNAADYIAVNAPQTGYDSHKALWTLLLLAALSGLAAVSITKKSKVNQ